MGGGRRDQINMAAILQITEPLEDIVMVQIAEIRKILQCQVIVHLRQRHALELLFRTSFHFFLAEILVQFQILDEPLLKRRIGEHRTKCRRHAERSRKQ